MYAISTFTKLQKGCGYRRTAGNTKSVKMHMDVQENTFIKADSHEMEIILNNFISNAVKYNKDGGEVFFP